MALGGWLLFYTQTPGTPPVTVTPILGVTMGLFVRGCALEDTIAGPSFAGFLSRGPTLRSALDGPSFAGELTRERA